MTINVYVGDVTEYLATAAGSEAKLITSTNYQNLSSGTYYTSIGDLDKLSYFGDILRQADYIFYIEPLKWSNIKMKYWTEEYLYAFCYANNKTIVGFEIKEAADKFNILTLADTRKSESPQIWNAGCSFTFGDGVDKCQRYGKLIGDYFDLPVSFLAKTASSLKWQADQILRSDLRKGDILIWGLTGIHRTVRWNKSALVHYTLNNNNNDDILRLLVSDHMMYDAVTSIYQVLNFCTKIDCKIILASLLANGIEPYINNCKNFISLQHHFGRDHSDQLADFGTDNAHPGPLMHQYYAQEIIEKYNNLYGDKK
jgi:hypothetical protein